MQLPIFGPAPDKPLCQSTDGSCAACCGLYNFRNRTPKEHQARLKKRTLQVHAAWPDLEKLKAVKTKLMQEEAIDVLFSTVRVCPFAGYLEPPIAFLDDAKTDSTAEPTAWPPAQTQTWRVGCMIHPLRHPNHADLRDLGVYPKEVCAGHFCANHEWLRPIEQTFAQTCAGNVYGQVVTDAGFIKSLFVLIENALLRPLKSKELLRTSQNQKTWDSFWQSLLQWPFQDPDPHRFGSFRVQGEEAVEYTAKGCLKEWNLVGYIHEERVLDALASTFSSKKEAQQALQTLTNILSSITTMLDA